jgi:hypothetical protein
MNGPRLFIREWRGTRRVVLQSANGVVVMRSKPHRSVYMARQRRTIIKRLMRELVAGKGRW